MYVSDQVIVAPMGGIVGLNQAVLLAVLDMYGLTGGERLEVYQMMVSATRLVYGRVREREKR